MNDDLQWGDRGEGYVIVQVIFFIVIFLLPFLGPELDRWPAPWAAVGSIVGIAFALLGIALSLAGVFRLGSNLTAVPHPKEDATFVEGGAYGIVRHPIYSGIILASVGWGFLTNNMLVLLMSVVLFLFFDIKTRREEKWLCAKFAEYPSYQGRVKKLIPYIY